MSVKRDIEQLTVTISDLRKLLVRGTMPDQPVLHERDDNSEDIERFVRDYGCTPDEALERGATHIIVLTNFAGSNVKVQPREAYVRSVDPNYDPPPAVTTQPVPAGEDLPADETAAISDPLVEALVRQARDKAAASDAASAKNAGR